MVKLSLEHRPFMLIRSAKEYTLFMHQLEARTDLTWGGLAGFPKEKPTEWTPTPYPPGSSLYPLHVGIQRSESLNMLCRSGLIPRDIKDDSECITYTNTNKFIYDYNSKELHGETCIEVNDFISNIQCPACGSPAYQGIGSIECSNSRCISK